jgi:hypothetical protein
VYERHRHLARAEPLLLARGRLERSQGARVLKGTVGALQDAPPVVNVIVRELTALERLLSPAELGEASAQARVHPLPGPSSSSACGPGAQEGSAEVGASMRAVAPPVQSFASGRRR